MAEPSSEAQLGWKLILCEISLNTGETLTLNNNLASFTYYEDLERICPTAVATVTDLAAQDLPLTGGEEFRIVLLTDQTSDEEKEYKFVVGDVKSPFLSFKGKIATINLISADSKVFSNFRCEKTYVGTGDQILATVFQDSGISTAPMVRGDKPFNKLLFGGEGISVAKMARRVCTQSIPTSGQKANTCGYFLWGTKDGYTFASIDHLLSTGKEDDYGGKEADWEYYQSPANTGKIPEHLIIQNYTVERDGDLKSLADNGVFRAVIAVTNLDSQEFKEEEWKLSDHWDDWAHIGSKSAFPEWLTKWLDDYDQSQGRPTRTFKLSTTNEAFFNEEEAASDATGRDGSEVNTEYPDWQPYTVCQYNARRATMAMNVSNVVVPGNSELRAGDKIKLHIQSSKPDAEKEADDEDLRRGGDYLIFRLAHRYTMSPRECFTATTLVKDSMNKNC